MKRFVTRSVATMAILATFSLGVPVVAVAGTTTTTMVPVTMKQYHAADRVYLAELKVINEKFILAVSSAKATYASSLVEASSSSKRISARSIFHSAIAQATLTRSIALSILGNAPMKPKSKLLRAVS